jgi:hypothetical protein
VEERVGNGGFVAGRAAAGVLLVLAAAGCEDGTSAIASGGTDAADAAIPDTGGSDPGTTATDPGTGLADDGQATADPGADAAAGLAHFSFFVTSLAALQALSGSQDGFGGDLRYGETGAGAGLRGADRLCAAIAERSLPGASAKQWRAFLSVTADGSGAQVDAVDRIGEGPWYDRLGRLVAPAKADLLQTRPTNGDATIANDLPNEDGVPNHRPDLTQAAVDNHDILTGSSASGTLYSSTATCKDWTSAQGVSAEGQPRVGHSWPTGGGGTPPAAAPGDGGQGDMENWMSALDESGCKAGVNLAETGGPQPGAMTVGSGGGYGGFYCFALIP